MSRPATPRGPKNGKKRTVRLSKKEDAALVIDATKRGLTPPDLLRECYLRMCRPQGVP